MHQLSLSPCLRTGWYNCRGMQQSKSTPSHLPQKEYCDLIWMGSVKKRTWFESDLTRQIRKCSGESSLVCSSLHYAWERAAVGVGGWEGELRASGWSWGGQGRETDPLHHRPLLKMSHMLPVEPILVPLLQLPEALNALWFKHCP